MPTLFAFLTRNALALRVLFISAQVIVVTYAMGRGIYPIAGWNTVFLGINVVWVIIILRERREVSYRPSSVCFMPAISPR